MDKYFIGYVGTKTIHMIKDSQAKKLTHINLAFAPMVGDITVMELNDEQQSELKRIRKANPHIKILVSSGGGNNRGHGEATRTKEGLDKLVKSTIDIVKKYDLDGIDCDWEFPGDTGIVEEKYQHTALFKAYREELDKLSTSNGRRYWLSTAAGTGQWYLDRTEIHESHKYLDFINLMTYDSSIGVKFTGHHTHLYEPAGGCLRPQSADYNIKLMTDAGVPIEKILIGAAFYSHQWDNVPDVNNGFFQESTDIDKWGPGYTDLMKIYNSNNGFIRYFDEEAKAPYLFNGSTFYTYDDEESIKYKCEYAKENNMKGVFYWVHNADREGVLFDAIFNNLKDQ